MPLRFFPGCLKKPFLSDHGFARALTNLFKHENRYFTKTHLYILLYKTAVSNLRKKHDRYYDRWIALSMITAFIASWLYSFWVGLGIALDL